MTDIEINIAIAEACGKGIQKGEGQPYASLIEALDKSYNTLKDYEIPAYTTNLNAMHEAEKVLHGTPEQYYNDANTYRRWKEYCELLEHNIHATAAQRAEAFLRTVGKWKAE